MKRIWLRHGADMERLTLHCTDTEKSLGIVGLVASSDVLRLVLSDTVALRIVGLAASWDVLRLVLSDTVALRIVGLVASSDVLRLVLSDTVALRIVGLVARADVLRLVLSDTVALRIGRIPADRLSSRPQVAFCAWPGPFLSCRHLATLL